MLSEAERIALETKIMPNIDRVMARSNTQQAFIQQVGPMAQQVASVNDLYASVMIAQAILESGWGQSTHLRRKQTICLGSKVHTMVNMLRCEQWKMMATAIFMRSLQNSAKYPSLKESFEDNAHVLKRLLSPGVYFYSGLGNPIPLPIVMPHNGFKEGMRQIRLMPAS